MKISSIEKAMASVKAEPIGIHKGENGEFRIYSWRNKVSLKKLNSAMKKCGVKLKVTEYTAGPNKTNVTLLSPYK